MYFSVLSPCGFIFGCHTNLPLINGQMFTSIYNWWYPINLGCRQQVPHQQGCHFHRYLNMCLDGMDSLPMTVSLCNGWMGAVNNFSVPGWSTLLEKTWKCKKWKNSWGIIFLNGNRIGYLVEIEKSWILFLQINYQPADVICVSRVI